MCFFYIMIGPHRACYTGNVGPHRAGGRPHRQRSLPTFVCCADCMRGVAAVAANKTLLGAGKDQKINLWSTERQSRPVRHSKVGLKCGHGSGHGQGCSSRCASTCAGGWGCKYGHGCGCRRGCESGANWAVRAREARVRMWVRNCVCGGARVRVRVRVAGDGDEAAGLGGCGCRRRRRKCGCECGCGCGHRRGYRCGAGTAGGTPVCGK